MRVRWLAGMALPHRLPRETRIGKPNACQAAPAAYSLGSVCLFLIITFFIPGCCTTEFSSATSLNRRQSEVTKLSSLPILDDESEQQPPDGESIEAMLARGDPSNSELPPGQLAVAIDGPVRTLSLREALHLATDNCQFVVDQSSYLSGNNLLLLDPQFVPSVFDLELQKSSQQGVEAALASFDSQLATGFQWGRNSVLQARSNLLSSDLLINDNSNFYGRLDKPFATGGTFSLIHNLNYANDRQSFPLDPRYSGLLRGEVRHPLLAGRGRTFTDIAGPNSYRTRQAIQGRAQAELLQSSAEIDFQLGRQRLLKQTVELYWDYWLAVETHAYHELARQHAQDILTRIRNRAASGLQGGQAAAMAQAEEFFFRRQSAVDAAQADVELAADHLCHAIGIEDNGPLVLTDRPASAALVFDLDSSIANALNQRLELSKQDLQVQLIRNQLYVAKQLQRPQFDLVSGVQLNGLGDDLFDAESGALADLIDTDDVGWNVGFEFSMPVGLRREKLNVRYLENLLSKAQSARHRQEKEIRHEILHFSRTVEKLRRSLATSEQRRAAAVRRRDAMEVEFQNGRTNLDQWLAAEDAVAEAELELARGTVELTKAELELLARQGVAVTE